MGFMRPYHSEKAGNYLGLAQWAQFGGAAESGVPDGAVRAAPGLGEHSRTILSALRYTADEIDQLLHTSVVQ
jgi:crotonobetainyl-CoA:carnitine CoA-transferase CaiB-like acyl-CoA transferase